jgi:hypothetical protein
MKKKLTKRELEGMRDYLEILVAQHLEKLPWVQEEIRKYKAAKGGE